MRARWWPAGRSRTAVIIAHRLSTIVGADQIAVVHDGRIVERGTHEQLRQGGGRYADLYDQQMAAQGLLATKHSA